MENEVTEVTPDLERVSRYSATDHVALNCRTAYRTRLLVSGPAPWFEELGEQVNVETGLSCARPLLRLTSKVLPRTPGLNSHHAENRYGFVIRDDAAC